MQGHRHNFQSGKQTVTMAHESSSVGSQCCGHVQVIAYDYCHVVYLVGQREEVE